MVEKIKQHLQGGRMKKITASLCITVLAVVFIAISTCEGYAVTGTYYTTNPVIRQPDNSNVCWAATSVSMIRTRGIVTTLTAHVVDVFGSYRDVGRTLPNVRQDFHNLYNITTNPNITGTMGFSTLQSYMKANKPVFAAISWGDGRGHAVAISGTDYSSSGLRIMDPAYGWEYPSYTKFKTSYQNEGTWVGSICFI